MTPLSKMSVDELNTLLTGSKWVLGILAVLIAMAGIFNQWVSDRIAKLQASAKVEAQRQLEQSESELRETKAKTVKLETKLSPRALPEAALLEVPYGFFIKDEKTYEAIEKHPEVLQLKEQLAPNDKLIFGINRKKVEATDLGKQFIKACVIDKAIETKT
jgi:hypothetical protein